MSVMFLSGCSHMDKQYNEISRAALKLTDIAKDKGEAITLTDVRNKGGHISEDYNNDQIDDMRLMVNDFIENCLADMEYYKNTCENLSKEEVEDFYYTLEDIGSMDADKTADNDTDTGSIDHGAYINAVLFALAVAAVLFVLVILILILILKQKKRFSGHNVKVKSNSGQKRKKAVKKNNKKGQAVTNKKKPSDNGSIDNIKETNPEEEPSDEDFIL